MKKLSILAAAIMAMAFTSTSFAQVIQSNANFHGDLNRSDTQVGHVDVSGSLTVPTSTNPLIVHFTDASNDFWCTTSSPSAVTASMPLNATGSVVIDVSKLNCVNQHNHNAVVYGSGTITFSTSLWQGADSFQYATLTMLAKSINVSFPCVPPCIYFEFTGAGWIYDPV